jgi:3-oxoacyl-[acyl-carrier-protein] synthase-1
MCSFDGIGAFSTREDIPTQASRPFDRDRDGLVPSGGAAALFLEDEESAKDRGVQILAEILGYGTSSDGYHLSSPSGKGLERAMLLALRDAFLPASAIDLVMAHATSTPAGDDKEAEALVRLFTAPKDQVPPYVAATKSLTGHEFWMAGTSQVVYGVLMSRAGFVAAHPTLQNPDISASTLRIPRRTETCHPHHILCNAAGFGGVNASLVLEIR